MEILNEFAIRINVSNTKIKFVPAVKYSRSNSEVDSFDVTANLELTMGEISPLTPPTALPMTKGTNLNSKRNQK